MKLLDCTIKLVCVLVLLIGINACTEKPVVEVSALTAAISPAKMAKPGAAIKLVSEPLILIAPNQPTEAVIVLESTKEHDEFTLEFSTSQGLALKETRVNQLIKNTSSSQLKVPIQLRVPVTLVAESSGRYYLNMHIRVNDTEAVLVRNLAVIVQVGPLPDHVSSFKKTVGESLIVLPAQETIATP